MLNKELVLGERMQGAMPALKQEIDCLLGLITDHAIDEEHMERTLLQVAGLRAMMDFASICLNGGDVPSLLRAARDRAGMINEENYMGLQEDHIPGSNIR